MREWIGRKQKERSRSNKNRDKCEEEQRIKVYFLKSVKEMNRPTFVGEN